MLVFNVTDLAEPAVEALGYHADRTVLEVAILVNLQGVANEAVVATFDQASLTTSPASNPPVLLLHWQSKPPHTSDASNGAGKAVSPIDSTARLCPRRHVELLLSGPKFPGTRP